MKFLRWADLKNVPFCLADFKMLFLKMFCQHYDVDMFGGYGFDWFKCGSVTMVNYFMPHAI